MAILGAMSIVMAIWFADSLSLMRIWLWMMSGLWLIRVVYQIVKPQGRMIPGLSRIMQALFAATTLMFILPAIVSSSR
ncbi:hypothetical protein GF359_03550 [candidate division WOR-3 bacterium]|uniref:Uncharacterized protein n=1 Tax=candidate division WOR-3 bacterium TaxID=2052148 RepID=A0A9D5K9X0_UNCW3|nr:hypothetical protein [candidate division WOR-3 bacterium]MBD3364270.1 hypothetical protein [candidate division WOR-3 bacterium]